MAEAVQPGFLARLGASLLGGPAPMQPDLVQTQLGAPVGPGQTRRPSVLPLTRDAQTGELQLALPRQPSPADDVARYWLQQGGNDRARAASLFRSHAISTGLKPAEIAETAALIEKPAGRMYEVAIHADPERFLDWDKPLSGQSERVRKGFGSIVDRDL